MSLISRRFAASLRGYQLLPADSDHHQDPKEKKKKKKKKGAKTGSNLNDEDHQQLEGDIDGDVGDDDDVDEVILEGDDDVIGFRDVVNDKSRLFEPSRDDDHHRGHQQQPNSSNKCFLLSLLLVTVLLCFVIIFFTLFSSSIKLLPPPSTRRPLIRFPSSTNFSSPPPPPLAPSSSLSSSSRSSSSSSPSSTVTLSPPPPPPPPPPITVPALPDFLITTTTNESSTAAEITSDNYDDTDDTDDHDDNSYNQQSSLLDSDPNNASIYERFIIYTPTCKIHAFPVFSPETSPLYQRYKSKEWKCPKDDGTSAIRRVNFTSVLVPEDNCLATYIERDASKESVKLGRTVAFKKQRVVDFPDADAVKVVCPSLKASRILPLIPVKEPIWQKKKKVVKVKEVVKKVEVKDEVFNDDDGDDGASATATAEPKVNLEVEESEEPDDHLAHRPNILAIGIDSVSRLNYLRHFTEMQALLKEEGNFEGPLYGLQKIGDNTFPNLIGMFTGRPGWSISNSLPRSLKMDDVPLIFKNFSAAGYLTTYIENMPNWGLWTYHQKNGFGKQQPLEYLMRPVNILVYKDMKNGYCYKDRLEMELYYDFLLDQMRAFRERKSRFLTFIHMGAISHDHFNYAQYADGPMTRFMRRIFAEHLHNDTLIIFYSDHGIRFGKIVQTDSGFQESRMPFMFFRLPQMMRLKDERGRWQDSEQLRAIFRLNTRRLTSQFDVHATLRHLLDEEPPRDEKYGHSLFSPIPLNRTCEQAGIPDEYCTCGPFSVLKEQKILKPLSGYMIDYLNGRLKPFKAKCAELSLDTVLKAKMSGELAPLKSSKSGGGGSNSTAGSRRRFFMRIRLKPSKGSVEMLLQGTLRPAKANKSSSGSWLDPSSISVISSIIRLDRYNEQSRCVANTRVESICYCRSLLAPAAAKKDGKKKKSKRASWLGWKH